LSYLVVGGPTERIARTIRRGTRLLANRRGYGVGIGLMAAWVAYLAQLAREIGW
jgi:hypothetical protein